MLNSIIERHNKLTPLSETEIKIIGTAARLFLEQGFSVSTHRQIAKKSGFGLGTVTYHYRAKEDMLRILIEELMDYHLDILEDTAEESNDKLFSYATEIAIQIALCEINKKAWDLYHSAYSHPPTYVYIKDWAAKKNYQLLGDRTPELHEADYRNIENITSGIEFAAISSPCDRYFTLEDKIRLALDTMMKAYDIPKDDRKAAIEKVLEKDYEEMARDMFDKFVKRLDNDIEKNE